MTGQQLINQMGTSMANHYKDSLPKNTMSTAKLLNTLGGSMANHHKTNQVLNNLGTYIGGGAKKGTTDNI